MQARGPYRWTRKSSQLRVPTRDRPRCDASRPSDESMWVHRTSGGAKAYIPDESRTSEPSCRIGSQVASGRNVSVPFAKSNHIEPQWRQVCGQTRWVRRAPQTDVEPTAVVTADDENVRLLLANICLGRHSSQVGCLPHILSRVKPRRASKMDMTV